MKIRRQVYELTPGDLREHPAWEFALDEEGEEGQDEATLRPIDADGPVDPGQGMCVVRTSFILNDGTEHTGFLSPQVIGEPSLISVEGDDGSSLTQPTIVTGDGHVMFWHGILKPTADAVSSYYRILGGKSPDQVFPVRFSTDIDVRGGEVAGTIEGFMFIDKVKRRFFGRKRVVVKVREVPA